jgi:hypothetical protein
MRGRRWYWVAACVLIVIGAVAVIVVRATRSPQLTLSMRPVRTLTTAACVAEAHRYGYSISAGMFICQPGTAAAAPPLGGVHGPSGSAPLWYHAVLVNRGSYALVDCSATGYDSGGRAVFHGGLPFTFAGIRGLFAGHGTTAFYWYLPKRTASEVLRYTASCSINPYQF